jgi:hypothetical protein
MSGLFKSATDFNCFWGIMLNLRVIFNLKAAWLAVNPFQYRAMHGEEESNLRARAYAYVGSCGDLRIFF